MEELRRVAFAQTDLVSCITTALESDPTSVEYHEAIKKWDASIPLIQNIKANTFNFRRIHLRFFFHEGNIGRLTKTFPTITLFQLACSAWYNSMPDILAKYRVGNSTHLDLKKENDGLTFEKELEANNAWAKRLFDIIMVNGEYYTYGTKRVLNPDYVPGFQSLNQLPFRTFASKRTVEICTLQYLAALYSQFDSFNFIDGKSQVRTPAMETQRFMAEHVTRSFFLFLAKHGFLKDLNVSFSAFVSTMKTEVVLQTTRTLAFARASPKMNADVLGLVRDFV